MNRIVLPAVLVVLFAPAIDVSASMEESVTNPFLSEYETPFEAPPFDKIEIEHYLPAFDTGLLLQNAEIRAIVEDASAPTFDNTIVALERSGALMTRVRNVLLNLSSADTNDELQEIVKDTQPRYARHKDDIRLNR